MAVAATAWWALTVPAAGAQQNPEPLGAYNVDPSQVSVSGQGSGAHMAIQIGIAHSSRIMGVGAFSPLAYDCNRRGTAYNYLCAAVGTSEVPGLAESMRNLSGREIDAVENLARQRIYAFAGVNDSGRWMSRAEKAVTLYKQFVPSLNIRYDDALQAGDTLPTNFDHPLSSSMAWNCATFTAPLANCGFDGAGAMLNWIYGPLNPRTDAQPDGALLAIDQGEFVARNRGMDEVAFLYVPKTCASGATCRLHVFLHACAQSFYQRKDTLFADYSGHTRWAETNGIVILFPQTYADNVYEDGCWDTFERYDEQFDQKGGTQIEAVMAMVARITSGFQGTLRATEYRHAEWDHYFVTASADEIGKLDGGAFSGWARTGESFGVYAVGTPGTKDVCRFFSTNFNPKSSHFYTADDIECGAVKHNADWQFEDVVFAVRSTEGTGTCAAGTQPVYRLYNDGHGGAPNHRYTTSVATRASMLAAGWTNEGVMGCTPL
jgi:hypothetical protein